VNAKLEALLEKKADLERQIKESEDGGHEINVKDKE
jgi:hypothetical protein